MMSVAAGESEAAVIGAVAGAGPLVRVVAGGAAGAGERSQPHSAASKIAGSNKIRSRDRIAGGAAAGPGRPC